MDKLSNRVTKIQSDNQLRFNDLEAQGENNLKNLYQKIKIKNFLEQKNLKILELLKPTTQKVFQKSNV